MLNYLKVLAIVYVLFLAELLAASEVKNQTLLDQDAKVTGFGELFTGLVNIGGTTRGITGGQGAWLFDRSLYLGGRIETLTHGPKVKQDDGKRHRIRYYNVEAILGYIFNSSLSHHLAVDLGLGVATFSKIYYNVFDKIHHDGYDKYDQSSSLVLEPRLYYMFNITRTFRAGFSGSYKYFSKKKDNIDFSSFGVHVNFRWGSF